MYTDLISTNNIPKLDLHGETAQISVISLKNFIVENYNLKNKYILIIHGVGKDILRKAIYEELSNNKNVESYKLDMFNSGCTIIKIKIS